MKSLANGEVKMTTDFDFSVQDMVLTCSGQQIVPLENDKVIASIVEYP
jgi:hypothetical protein